MDYDKKALKRQWYINNKEHVKKYMKNYYNENNDKFSKPYICYVCNTEIRTDGINKHNKTYKHQRNVNKIVEKTT